MGNFKRLNVICVRWTYCTRIILYTNFNVRGGRNHNIFIQWRPMFRRYGYAALEFKIFNPENVRICGTIMTTLSGNTDVGKA